MKKNNSKTKIESIGESSVLRPTQNEKSITLKDVKEEINVSLNKAKTGFLTAAKTEAKKDNDEALKNAKEVFLIEARANASKEIREQVQTDKASLITVFGIFASIISFLTIEFQFLKTICSFEKLLGFTLILASLLLCFNIALDYLVKSRTDNKTPKPNLYFTIFITIVFVCGICFMFLGNEEKCKDNKIYDKYSENFTNQQTEFNQNYVNEQNKKYSELETKIENIEKQIKK